MSTKKNTTKTSNTIKTKKISGKSNIDKNFLDYLKDAKKYTEEFDKDYKVYSKTKQFNLMMLNNPTLIIINHIYHTIYNKSLINQLLKNNNELSEALQYCFKLETLVKSKRDENKNPIISGLINKGFNTIYDIMLENTDSFFFLGFLSHLVSLKILSDPNKFIQELNKNKIYQELREKKIIEQMQLKDLFTRVKRYQF